MKVLSLFSGIGAFEEALRNVGIDFEVVNYCEIEDNISKSYSIIHNVDESKRIKDISDIDAQELVDFDLVTLGFPCVDISIIGKQEGIIKGETRSGLVYKALDIIKEKKPSYVLIENVKSLLNKKHISQYNKIIEMLTSLDYECKTEILNCKEYGHAQNRERTYIVAIQKYKNKEFSFPNPNKNSKVILKDIVELGEENDYYYLSNKNIRSFVLKKGSYKSRFTIKNIYKDIGCTLCAKGCKDVITNNYIVDVKGIRGLTEREGFKLQGFNPDYFRLLIENEIPRGTIYKMTGNSIPVKVLEEIFKKLFVENLE